MVNELSTIGHLALWSFWMPVLVWTLLAGLYLSLERIVRMHPTMAYYGRTAILFALPAGILSAALMPAGTTLLPGYLAEIVVSSLEGSPVGEGSGASSGGFAGSVLASYAWIYLFSGILTAGAAFLAAFGLLRHVRNHILLAVHIRRRLTPAGLEVRQLADRLRQELQVQRPVAIRYASEEHIPYTFGWFRPVVVVPAHEQDRSRLQAILWHELVHVRRYDYLIQYAEQVVLALGLFHPLVRLLVRDAQRFREMSCDAEVLSGTPVDLHLYASLLLEYACNSRKPALSVMISMASPTTRLKERIMNMQEIDKSPQMNLRVRIMSMSVAAVVLMSVAGLVACSDISNSQMQFEVEELQEVPIAGQPAGPLDSSQVESEVFIVVEQMPEPIGGMEAVYAGLVYPELARRAGIEGRVVVQFIVDENGDVTNPEIIRSIGGGTDEAVLEAINAVKFRPGVQRGRNVKVQFQLPIVFRLGE